ncbi:MAG: glycosyltransferase, partial [Bacteroidales bacterium]
MISFIICSINPEQYIQFERNINQTCGIPFELLKHDNREDKWGLCKVYNYYSKLAKYDIICYIHEDVLFHTVNWGRIIHDFYKNNPQTGC